MRRPCHVDLMFMEPRRAAPGRAAAGNRPAVRAASASTTNGPEFRTLRAGKASEGLPGGLPQHWLLRRHRPDRLVAGWRTNNSLRTLRPAPGWEHSPEATTLTVGGSGPCFHYASSSKGSRRGRRRVRAHQRFFSAPWLCLGSFLAGAARQSLPRHRPMPGAQGPDLGAERGVPCWRRGRAGHRQRSRGTSWHRPWHRSAGSGRVCAEAARLQRGEGAETKRVRNVLGSELQTDGWQGFDGPSRQGRGRVEQGRSPPLAHHRMVAVRDVGSALVRATRTAVCAGVRRYSARRRNAMGIGGASTPSRRSTGNCTGETGIGTTVMAVGAITTCNWPSSSRFQWRNRHRSLVAEVLAVRLGGFRDGMAHRHFEKASQYHQSQPGWRGASATATHWAVPQHWRYRSCGDTYIRDARTNAEQPTQKRASAAQWRSCLAVSGT